MDQEASPIFLLVQIIPSDVFDEDQCSMSIGIMGSFKMLLMCSTAARKIFLVHLNVQENLFNSRFLAFISNCWVFVIFLWVFSWECWTESNKFGKRSKPSSSRWSGAVKLITSFLFHWGDKDSKCPTTFTVSWSATVTLLQDGYRQGELQFSNNRKEGKKDCCCHWQRNCEANVAKITHHEQVCLSCCTFLF